jgi:putative endonuclease
MKRNYFVYILTTRNNTVLYTGVTSNLLQRIQQHEQGIVGGFTKKYNVHKLVYAEEYSDIEEAIHREKCIKRWKRNWKIELIEKANPDWDNLLEKEYQQNDVISV